MIDFSTGLKSVTMPLDKCQYFLTMENEEVGEMAKYLLEYAMFGKEPSFRNKWQGMVYSTFAIDIKHQIETCESRREKCSNNKGAGNKDKSTRKTTKKSGGKTVPASTEAEGNEVVVTDSFDSNDGETIEPMTTEVVNADVNPTEVGKVVDDHLTSPEVKEVIDEDITFIAFTSLYEKKDAGSYNTESAWNALSDDDKRSALRYVKDNLVGKVDIYRRDYPSKFLGNHPWKK